jgi:TetR/AcrR family fatty acid metabolism transcriptional regulator
VARRPHRTRRERVEERERAIIEAAGEILAESGLEKATMSEIARRAGVAEGTVYLYFENKGALLRAVQLSFYEELTRRAERGVAEITDTRGRLHFLASLHLEVLLEEWPTVMAVLANHRDVEDYLRRNEQYQFNRTYVAVFDAVVRDGVNRGELRGDPPLWLLRDLFYGTLEYMVRTMLLHEQRRSVAEAVDQLLDVLVSGMAVGGEARGDATSAMHAAVMRLEAVAERLEAGASPARRPGRARSR